VIDVKRMCAAAKESLRRFIRDMPDTQIFAIAEHGAIFHSADLGRTWCSRLGDPSDGLTTEGLPKLRLHCEADQLLVRCADDQLYVCTDDHSGFVGEGDERMPVAGILPAAEDAAYLAAARDSLENFLVESELEFALTDRIASGAA
jgi:hypothetical protein